MSRNDGRPRSVAAMVLDPNPWASFNGGSGYATKRYASPPGDVYVELRPRPGYIQDEEAYL